MSLGRRSPAVVQEQPNKKSPADRVRRGRGGGRPGEEHERATSQGADELWTVTSRTARFTLERAYPAAPARVFAAWADPAVKARWFARTGEGHQLDFRVGGREVASGGPDGGPVVTFETFYRESPQDASSTPPPCRPGPTSSRPGATARAGRPAVRAALARQGGGELTEPLPDPRLHGDRGTVRRVRRIGELRQGHQERAPPAVLRLDLLAQRVEYGQDRLARIRPARAAAASNHSR